MYRLRLAFAYQYGSDEPVGLGRLCLPRFTGAAPCQPLWFDRIAKRLGATTEKTNPAIRILRSMETQQTYGVCSCLAIGTKTQSWRSRPKLPARWQEHRPVARGANCDMWKQLRLKPKPRADRKLAI